MFYSSNEAIARDNLATPNATDFCHTIETIAAALPPKEKAAFMAGAKRAAELCGKHIFAFHIQHKIYE